MLTRYLKASTITTLITLFILLFATSKPAKRTILIVTAIKSYKPPLKPKEPPVKHSAKSLK
jgi:hypothetical protein